jgi:hypothetical protein
LFKSNGNSVSNRAKNVCLRTIAFTPPFYQNGKLLNIDSLSKSTSNSFRNLPISLMHDRMLTWTFCFSLYSLLCTESPSQVFVFKFRASRFGRWTRDDQKFTDVFQCSGGSAKLNQFLNGCLLREQKGAMFRDLVKHSWLS